MNYLRISHVSRSYGTIRALDDFSLTVRRGDILALVGPDGAGKTTLMRIVCRLLEPDEGEIEIGGQDIQTGFDQVKARLGYMPQTFSLYPDLTVEENLLFYAGIYGHTGEAYVRKRDLLYRFSQLGPFARRRAGALSGGMKQKLSLSCTLLHDPELLILDEPTTGVDPLSRRYFWEMLSKLRSDGITILVSTPYMDEAARADRACLIHSGKKLREGTPDDLAKELTGTVYYASGDFTARQAKALQQIPGLSARLFGRGLQIHDETGRTSDAVSAELRRLGVDAEEIAPRKPTLEDRFIQLMGQV
jgi:ABC-type multidrug transport system ATPase subunit